MNVSILIETYIRWLWNVITFSCIELWGFIIWFSLPYYLSIQSWRKKSSFMWRFTTQYSIIMRRNQKHLTTWNENSTNRENVNLKCLTTILQATRNIIINSWTRAVVIKITKKKNRKRFGRTDAFDDKI